MNRLTKYFMKGLLGQTAVYLPQSYNFAGEVLIFPLAQAKTPENRQFGGDVVHRIRGRFRRRSILTGLSVANSLRQAYNRPGLFADGEFVDFCEDFLQCRFWNS